MFITDRTSTFSEAAALITVMNVSRAEALVNCSVTFPRQWIRFAHVAAAKLDGIFLAVSATKSLVGGRENADLLVFTEAPSFAESTERG